MPPHRFSERLTLRVSYRWRRAIEDDWTYGNITLSHDVDSRPDYTMPIPNRKPGAAKQEQDRQDKLYYEWEHLMRLALHSVREYFRGEVMETRSRRHSWRQPIPIGEGSTITVPSSGVSSLEPPAQMGVTTTVNHQASSLGKIGQPPSLAIVRGRVSMRIPRAFGHPFHEHLDSDSTLTWTLIPRPLGH